jgi:hypothetical protein
MVNDMNSRLLVIAAGCCLLVPAWIRSFSSGVPTLYSPLPTLTIVPAFMLSRWHLESFAVAIPSILLLLWIPGLLQNRSQVPTRTVVLLGVLTTLAIVDLAFEWKYGVEYRGLPYTVAVYVINLIWIVCLWWMTIYSRRNPSFRTNLLCHWLLFAWLAWYAFPYLGELP